MADQYPGGRGRVRGGGEFRGGRGGGEYRGSRGGGGDRGGRGGGGDRGGRGGGGFQGEGGGFRGRGGRGFPDGRGGGFRPGGRGGRGGGNTDKVFGQDRFPAPDDDVTKAEDRIVKTTQTPENKSKHAADVVKAIVDLMANLHVSNHSPNIPLPVRPAYGTDGRQVTLWANYFRVDLQGGVIYTYHITVKSSKVDGKDMKEVSTDQHAQQHGVPDADDDVDEEKNDVTGRKLKAIIELAIDQLRQEDPSAIFVTEFKSKVVSLRKIKRQTDTIEVSYRGEDGTKTPQSYWVTLTRPHEASLKAVLDYVRTMSDPSDPNGSRFPKFSVPVDALGVILGFKARKMPEVTAVGSARYFLCPEKDRESAVLSPKLEAIRGYFQSIRLGTNRLLLNVNVTHGVFKQAITVGKLCDYLQLAVCGGSGSDMGAFSRLKSLSKFLAKTRIEVQFMNDKGTLYSAKKAMCGLTVRGEINAPPSEIAMPQWYGGPREVKFRLRAKDGQTTVMDGKPANQLYAVAQYLAWKYPNKSFDPRYPLVNLGTPERPVLFPAEWCTILPGQPVRAKLTGDETTEMLRFACRSPFDNAVSITTGGRDTLGLDDGADLAKFGVTIDKQLLTVKGRELVPPRVSYGVNKVITPANGSWNMRSVKVVKPGRNRIANWGWLQFTDRQNGPNKEVVTGAVAAFAGFLNENGIIIDRNKANQGMVCHLTHPAAMEREVLDTFEKVPKPGATTQLFLLIILPRQDTQLYAYVKQCADIKFGYHTVCILERNLMKGDPMTCANVGLKWNLKNGGTNHKLDDPVGLIKSGKTMVVGYDVTHPTNLPVKKEKKDKNKKGDKDERDEKDEKGEKDKKDKKGERAGPPSLVGLVASIDKDLGQWPAVAWEHTSKQEMLDEKFVEHFGSRLDLWKMNNSGVLPENIMIYRDGVSEGQFSQVLGQELPHIRKACSKRYGPGKMPKISIVVSVKRHQTRFFPTSTANMTTKGNIKPGTVVDRGVTQARVWDFYLTAHAAIQGTARPAHYTVLLDEIFQGERAMDATAKANQLERMTHQLCYAFGRATKAVSICPPAYYADIVCERARVHRPGYGDVSDAGSTMTNTNAQRGPSLIIKNYPKDPIEVHGRLRDSMYYI